MEMSNLKFAKKSRISSQEIINAMKSDRCEICGNYCSNEPHHVISRGAGGPDIPENMIQLCGKCHRKAHNGDFDKMWLFNIISRRMHKKRREILETVNSFRPTKYTED